MYKRRKQSRTIIMITSGFEEESTIICLKRLRRAGLNVKLVGLTTHHVVGAHGLTVRPDCSIGDLEGKNDPQLMVIPGYEESAEKLLADPRFHRLFQATAANKGYIGIMRAAETAFGRAGLPDMLSDSHCLRQGKVDTTTFSQSLADKMTFPGPR